MFWVSSLDKQYQLVFGLKAQYILALLCLAIKVYSSVVFGLKAQYILALGNAQGKREDVVFALKGKHN